MPSSLLAIDGPATAAIQKELRSKLIKTSRGVVEAATWGEGPAVLLLHGAMGGYDQGILLAQTVTYPRFHYVAISRPGYLGSALRIGRMPQEQADLCAEVLDQLGAENAAVIAISGGGPTALQFALRHAERCRGLVMISACSDRLDVPIPFRFQVMKLIARIPGATNAMRKKLEREPEKAAQRSIPDEVLRRKVFEDPETPSCSSRCSRACWTGCRSVYQGRKTISGRRAGGWRTRWSESTCRPWSCMGQATARCRSPRRRHLQAAYRAPRC